ncbi:fork-head transcriptional regulator FHL1-like [Cyprinodon tularosa]|uniref:fork-head transcriptional regulator FHL1-like n=1 Tax=Cyprinodon tularosa TaxID=77115 RepID=UPI0018E1F973|nr:fork-head transcriptional regulator FHL1-like [Cyprinodon tularosa]
MTERTDQPDSGEQLRSAISHQGLLLGQHETLIQTMVQQQTQVMQTMSTLTHELQDMKALLNLNQPTSVPPPAPRPPAVAALPPVPGVGVSIPVPEPFSEPPTTSATCPPGASTSSGEPPLR